MSKLAIDVFALVYDIVAVSILFYLDRNSL